MAKPLIVANWKMNPAAFREAERLFLAAREGVKRVRGVNVVICPPFPWLAGLSQKYSKPSCAFGAQDVFWAESGAYTGEVSPLMLKSSRVKYVIVGHSERRRFLGETDEAVNKKVRAVLKAGLIPIIAIGEDVQDSQDVVPSVIARELHGALHGLARRQIGRTVIAYEPVWAIGTGKADTPDNATRRAIYIRKLLVRMAGAEIASSVRILYGGSVTAKNAASFLSTDIRGMDGLLVGGASLKAGEFVNIVRAVVAQGRMHRIV